MALLSQKKDVKRDRWHSCVPNLGTLPTDHDEVVAEPLLVQKQLHRALGGERAHEVPCDDEDAQGNAVLLLLLGRPLLELFELEASGEPPGGFLQHGQLAFFWKSGVPLFCAHRYKVMAEDDQ